VSSRWAARRLINRETPTTGSNEKAPVKTRFCFLPVYFRSGAYLVGRLLRVRSGMQLSHSKLEAFTGNVFDQATGKPIAGSEVHYLDDNPPMDMKGKPLRGIIRGTVTNGPRRKFTGCLRIYLWRLMQSGVIAPGYYADKFYGSGGL